MEEQNKVRKVIEALPEIAINIDIPLKEFLDRMTGIARETGNYKVETWPGGMGEVGANLFPKDDLGFEDLVGQLMHKSDKKNWGRVETGIKQWIPGDISKEDYLRATHHIFDDLIKTYNSRYKKRHRMRVVKDKSRDLPPKATEALKNFIFAANKTSLHPLDWQRLYTFVRVCHATRANPEKGLIWGILSKEGFDYKKAEYIADIATHLLAFMKCK